MGNTFIEDLTDALRNLTFKDEEERILIENMMNNNGEKFRVVIDIESFGKTLIMTPRFDMKYCKSDT